MDSVRARAFIDERFFRAYGATKAAAYGEYLGLQCPQVGCAALGYRRAGSEALFLERYLDQSIEREVSKALNRPVERERIVEIGNLAADNAWSMIALWGAATNDLGGSSEVVVATLTQPLRRMFTRIGVPVRELVPADPRRLGATAADWGSYYLNDPWVCVGAIAEGQQAIAAFLARRRRCAA